MTKAVFQEFVTANRLCGSILQFGAPQRLASNLSAPQVLYHITPDGKKIFLDRVAQQVSQFITVVTSFTVEFKK
jgi:hypothetical protein